MSTSDRYILLVLDHTLLIPLDNDYDTHVLHTTNNTFSSNLIPTGWERHQPSILRQRQRDPWMSASTILSSGSSTSLLNVLSTSIATSTTTAIPTATFPPPRNFTGPFPSPPAQNTTITTNILTTTAVTSIQTTSTNYILSTSTATQPAALATEATSLLDSTSSLTHTNFILTIVLGSLTVILLILIIILFCLYTRRKRRRRDTDSDSDGDGRGDSRRMSVAAPGAMFISQEPTSPTNRRHQRGRDSLPRVSQAPLSMNMALSSNPYGEGPAPRIDSTLFPTSGASGSGNPPMGQTGPLGPMGSPIPTRFSRSASNPESALWMPGPQANVATMGTVPRGRVATPIPFPRLNVGTISRSGTVVRSAGSGSPVSSLTPSGTPREPGSGMLGGGNAGLERQPSLPLYHRALQEQASHQRERAGVEEAGRLGIPVITGFMGAGQRASVQSGESEFFDGGHVGDEHDAEHDHEIYHEGDSSSGSDEGEKEMEIYDAGIEGSGDYGLRTASRTQPHPHPDPDPDPNLTPDLEPEPEPGSGNSLAPAFGSRRRGDVRSSTRASSGVFPE